MDREAVKLLREILDELKTLNSRVVAQESSADGRNQQANELIQSILKIIPKP